MTESSQVAQARNALLLSHANPEDNEFTLWLALQLANEGYRVWCDVTKLLGGEVFWDNIEEVIKTRAAKVLYVLSRTSNAKDGPLKELHFAQGVAKREKLKDFVIPLHIDDLPHGDITIEITRVNTVPFAQSWGAGLAKLLEKLEEDRVPKDPKFNRTTVNEWWRAQFSAEQGLRKEPEEYLSNWFPITLPKHVYFHSLSRRSIGVLEVPPILPYPAVHEGMFLITFAEAADFNGKLGPEMHIAKAGGPLDVAGLLAEPKSEFGKHLFQLLRLAWYSEDTGDFHLSYEAAKALGELAIKSYIKKAGGPPKEMFIHGKVRFEAEEWAGFADAAGTDTSMVGVRIREERHLKLYRKGQNPVLRGLANIRSERSAHLWTRGWTPRIQTYPGREVPNPLIIDIGKGEADINVVLKDILALTKLNYNTCIFGDGMPITLKFADAVGEILTAGPIKDVPPLPFGHYI